LDIVATIGMKELVDQNTSGIFGPKDKDTVRITRIGVAAINVKGPYYLAVGGKVTPMGVR
jgi:hypothetical protein